jgi:hypothetical protein
MLVYKRCESAVPLTFCLVYEPAPGHSVIISSFASALLFETKANATPENVVPCHRVSFAIQVILPEVLTKSIPTISCDLLLPAPSTSTALPLGPYCTGAPIPPIPGGTYPAPPYCGGPPGPPCSGGPASGGPCCGG